MKVNPGVLLVCGWIGTVLMGIIVLYITNAYLEKAATTPATAHIVEKEGFKCIAIYYKERLATDCVYEPITETTP